MPRFEKKKLLRIEAKITTDKKPGDGASFVCKYCE